MARENRRVREFQEHHNAADAEVAQIVRNTAQPEVAKVVSQELGPIVREAIDESVLGAIRDLLDLTPKAVKVLGEELEATTTTRDGEVIPDIGRRATAARTVMRYTVGHPALAPEKQVGGLTVNMGIPMQEAQAADAEAEPADAEELRTCDICGEEKPVSEFVADSDRCVSCFHDWRKAALEKFHLELGE